MYVDMCVYIYIYKYYIVISFFFVGFIGEHIWELKDKNIEHTIQWEIIKKNQAIYTTKKKCMHTLKEK